MTCAVARSRRLARGSRHSVGAWLRCAALALALVVAASPASAVPPVRVEIEPPVADAGGTTLSTHVHQPVTIDGSNSFDGAADAGDPQRGLINFRWSIVRAPAGSSAWIDATSPAPVLVPDVAGNYVLQLRVIAADGRISAPAQATVTAYDGNAAPVALADAVRTVAVHAPVVLDAVGSFDPDGGALAFRWSFASVPAQSRQRDADLIDARTATARFTPDVAGDYVLLLQVADGQFVAEARTLVHARADVLPPDAEPRAIVEGDGVELDATMSADTNAVPRPLHYAWSLVARPGASLATRESIRGPAGARARFTPDVDGIYVFRLRVGNGVQDDARNVLVHFVRVETGDKTRSSARTMTTIGPRAQKQGDSDVAFGAGVLRLALNLHPRALDVTAGGQGTIDVKLVASGHAPDDDDEVHGLERNNKSHGSGVRASLSGGGLPPGVAVQFASTEVAPGETTTMTVTTANTTPPGVYRLQVTASPLGADVAIVPVSSVTLRIRAPLRAPPVACGGVDLSKVASRIYVSPTGSNDAQCGASPATACATIQRGIDGCAGTGCAVLVRYGRYSTTSSIILKDGVNVFGSCTFGSVASPGYRTVVDALPSPAGTPALLAQGINSPTLVSGLVVASNDATATGAASIAMVASQSNGLSLANMLLSSGGGGPGGSGTSNTTQAGPGGAGIPGAMGGAAGQSCVANHTSSAGNGGTGGISANGTNLSSGCSVSSPGPTAGQASGGASGGGAGPTGDVGIWCTNRPHDQPGDGMPGVNGNPGQCGAPARISASTAGSFNGTTWSPSQGDNGQVGSVGAGGGGGGAGGVCGDCCDSNIAYYGLAGGGGGGGGCGGALGTGGQQGGASIPLVLVNSNLVWNGAINSLVPGPGGKGGDAGSAAPGGQGGAAGAGVTTGQTLFVAHWCGGVGGSGGNGGYGGAGSAGAGGDGGPSIGFALVGTSSQPTTDIGIYPPLPGPPGRGGTGGAAAPLQGACKGPDGQSAVGGLGATTYAFDGKPVNNFLAPGDHMFQGDSRTSLDGTVQFVLQNDANLCLYKSGAYRWCSKDENFGMALEATMQTDGNFCVDNGPGPTCSNTYGHPGVYLVVQNDGYVVLYDGVTPIWQVPKK
jgi:hypothetical protein